MNLAHCTSGYSKMLVISDIHSAADKLKQALDYATKHDMFVVFLGDLVDGVVNAKPMETLLMVKSVIESNCGALIIGNHDDKFYRWAQGNEVVLGNQQQSTLESIGDYLISEFSDCITDIITNCNAYYYAYLNNWLFAHGAVAESMWDYPVAVSKYERYMLLYGQTNGQRDNTGFPVRLYSWTDHVPSGKWCMVGHDRAPFHGKKITHPIIHVNNNKGRTIFMDTSCGKIPEGKLSCAILDIQSVIRLEKFIAI